MRDEVEFGGLWAAVKKGADEVHGVEKALQNAKDTSQNVKETAKSVKDATQNVKDAAPAVLSITHGLLLLGGVTAAIILLKR